MASRHRSRERALQMIYQWDVNPKPAGEVREAYWETLADGLAVDVPLIDHLQGSFAGAVS